MVWRYETGCVPQSFKSCSFCRMSTQVQYCNWVQPPLQCQHKDSIRSESAPPPWVWPCQWGATDSLEGSNKGQETTAATSCQFKCILSDCQNCLVWLPFFSVLLWWRCVGQSYKSKFQNRSSFLYWCNSATTLPMEIFQVSVVLTEAKRGEMSRLRQNWRTSGTVLVLTHTECFIYCFRQYRGMSYHVRRWEKVKKPNADSLQALQGSPGPNSIMPHWWHKQKLLRENALFTKEIQ